MWSVHLRTPQRMRRKPRCAVGPTRRKREAQARGVFGAPSFTTADGELFWGHDRLEQALRWAAKQDH